MDPIVQTGRQFRKDFAQCEELSVEFKCISYKLDFMSLLLLKRHTIAEVCAKFRDDNFFLPTCRLCEFQCVGTGGMQRVI